VAAAGLIGAALMARGRPAGLALIEDTPEGAWRSFFAAVICLPAFLALRFFAWSESGMPSDGLFRPVVAEALGLACAWAGFALASMPLAMVWGRGAAWPRFLAAWNWSNVVQYMVLLAVAVLTSLPLPPFMGPGLMLAGLGYALWIEWFVVRQALGVSGGRAAAMVALDLSIGLFVGGVVQRLSV
jgi:hypothetical protein